MPNYSHKLVPTPRLILFTVCSHTTPSTPFPAQKPTTSTFPFRCLPCDISHHTLQQNQFLETYNSLIRDQKARLLIAADREGTNRQGRYDDEMVAEGERRIRNWALKRAEKVNEIWKGFLERWEGGTAYDGDRKTTLKLRLKVNSEMGFDVEGLPKSLGFEEE